MPFESRQFYGESPSNFVDFYSAARKDVRPLAVMIHGGFWRVCYGLDHAAGFCTALSAAGFTVANLEYRRVGEPGGGWPGTLDDVKLGVAFARRSSAGYGGDAARTTVLGHSAGGHLALWLAAEMTDLTLAIGLGAVANLPKAFALGLSSCAVGEFLGGSPDEVPERYAAADPARPTNVPRVLIHGDADDIVPVQLARGFPGRVTEIPGADHFAVIDPASAAWPIVLDFLERPASAR